MEKKNEKASKILGEINKALGEDSSLELLHILKRQGRISEKQWEEMVKIQKEAINKQRLIREAILDAVKALKVKLPDIFDVKVSNQKEFPGSIKVSNFEEIKFPGEVGFKKPAWFADLLSRFVSFPIIKVLSKQLQNVNLVGPTDPAKAIAVQLSDGRKFYTALNQIIQTSAMSAADLQSILSILQQIEDNTDTLELKTDQVNLNTDTLEALLAQFQFTAGKLKVDAVLTATAAIVNDSNIFLTDIFTITNKTETTIRTYTVPTGKTFRLVAYQVNSDNPLGVNVQLKVDGVVKLRTYIDPNRGTPPPTYTAPVKIADAGQVVTITEVAKIGRGEINTMLVGIES